MDSIVRSPNAHDRPYRQADLTEGVEDEHLALVCGLVDGLHRAEAHGDRRAAGGLRGRVGRQINPYGEPVEHDGVVGTNHADCISANPSAPPSCEGWTRSPRRRTRRPRRCLGGDRGPPPRAEFRSLVHRYYDPTTSQFLSVDPLADETGSPYAFASGDPVNGGDPSGEATQECSSGSSTRTFVCEPSNAVSGFPGGWVYKPVVAMASNGDFAQGGTATVSAVLNSLTSLYANVYLHGNPNGTPTGSTIVNGESEPLNPFGGPTVNSLTAFKQLYIWTATQYDAVDNQLFEDNTMQYLFAESKGAIASEYGDVAEFAHELGELGDPALEAFLLSLDAAVSPNGACSGADGTLA